MSGDRKSDKGNRPVWKSRRGFGTEVRSARTRPSNTTVRDLADDRFAAAVLGFIQTARVGTIEAGATAGRRESEGR